MSNNCVADTQTSLCEKSRDPRRVLLTRALLRSGFISPATRSRQRAVRLVFAMFVTFVVCWSPFLVYVLLYQLAETTHDNGVRHGAGARMGTCGHVKLKTPRRMCRFSCSESKCMSRFHAAGGGHTLHY